jgi:hypothetical protein
MEYDKTNHLIILIMKLRKYRIYVLATLLALLFTPGFGQEYACFEIEHVQAVGHWKLSTANAGYSGDGYFEWHGGDKFGAPPPENSILTFKFTVPTSGIYTVVFRGRRDYGQCGCPPNAASDACNDIFVKIDNGPWIKTLIKGNFGSWVWDWNYEKVHGSVVRSMYQLSAGEHTMQIGGRSAGVQLDAFKIISETASRPSGIPNCPPPYCEDITYDKWDLTQQTGFLAKGTTEASKSAIQINTINEQKDEWATARATFNGPAGKYNIVLTTLQETDGECFYRVKINGNLIMEYQNPRIYGTSTPEYAPYTMGKRAVDIPKDAVIQVDFKSNSNQLVPEGGGFGYARARWKGLNIGGCNVTVNDWYDDACIPSAITKFVKIDDAEKIEMDTVTVIMGKPFQFIVESDDELTWKWKGPQGTLGSDSGVVVFNSVKQSDAGIYTGEFINELLCKGTTLYALNVECGTTVSGSLQVGESEAKDTLKVNITEKSTLHLMAEANEQGTWSWKGPNGFTAGNTGKATIENITLGGMGKYVATFINQAGCVSTIEFEVTVNCGDLAEGWTSMDIGAVDHPGTACGTQDISINGGGGDVWANADRCHFVYKRLVGDGGIIAKVERLDGTQAWSMGGVMMRESLDPASKQISMLLIHTPGSMFRRRTQTGGATTQGAFPSNGEKVPYWVKLARKGDIIAGYSSSDGQNWTLWKDKNNVLGYEVIDLGDTVYIGLAATSHTPDAPGISIYSNISVGSDINVTGVPANVKGYLANKTLKVYPNPAQHSLTVELEDAFDATISVLDILGRKVLSVPTDRAITNIDISGLKAGMYHVVMQQGDDLYTNKVIVR